MSEAVKQFVSDYWNERSINFDEAPNHNWQTLEQKQAWLDLLRELAGAEPVPALDLGCGTGFLGLLLAELGHTVTGVGIAPEMIARAEQKSANASLATIWRVGDVEMLPDADDTYGFATGRHLIWTLPNPAEALKEWRRVLRPGGRIALFEFGGRWGADSAQSSPSVYEPYKAALPYYGGTPGETLVAALEGAGFADVAVRTSEDDVLWGGAASSHRYIVSGRKP